MILIIENDLMILLTKTIVVFLEYKDNEDWFGRELLSDGKILYACIDTINVLTYM